MRITETEELSKSRSRVWIDGEPAFVLYKGELRAYHINAGEEIAEEDYRTILEEVLPKRAKLRAMNLLTKREYTEKQLYDKLKSGGYPEEVIRTALDYVASFRYTDDLRYAVSYISDHETSRSRRRIEQDLLGKGIGRQTLEQAFDEWEARGGSQDEQAMIRALLRKRNYDPDTADFQERQKTYAFLMRKGFSGEAVGRALRFEESGEESC
ncbi:MAG: recombination regulator RecX [Roseburia sp.]|nr:recombination regulator RecX [Roseburia sp.]MCM1097172.1 recombination regulator RecX [Ruminococcus flavefaciens]